MYYDNHSLDKASKSGTHFVSLAENQLKHRKSLRNRILSTNKDDKDNKD